MKKYLFGLPLFVVFVLWTAPASAQSYQGALNLTPVDDPLGACTSDMTADECMALGTKPKKCSDMQVNSYLQCVLKCTCQYNENVKKCDGQTCRDTQKVDYDACQTQCQIDWV